MVSRTAEERVRLPMLKARWLTQTFIHWPYEPAAVQKVLPRGLTVDVHDGVAWVGLTPFAMTAVRPAGLPPTPFSFPETNLRTYVRLPDGRDGLWFLSLEVSAPLMLAAQAIGVPYHLGRLRIEAQDGVVRYTGARRGGRPAYALTVRPGAPLLPGPLDVWLTGRWRAFSPRRARGHRRLWEIAVEHEPWPLHRAVITSLDQTLAAAAGLPPPSGPALAHFSPGVRHVRLAVPRPITTAA
ncbi:YqjF family protein [Streptomyces sp. URMC 127]|uniref:YqjF family protein n=1 Tax=Streptomyces sp. URMC 127 TaxID=3423402 RepID=UPI003F19E4A3